MMDASGLELLQNNGLKLSYQECNVTVQESVLLWHFSENSKLKIANSVEFSRVVHMYKNIILSSQLYNKICCT